MPNAELVAGALCQMLRHGLTGCSRAAAQAAGLLDRLAEQSDTDRELRQMCESMAAQLAAPESGARR